MNQPFLRIQVAYFAVPHSAKIKPLSFTKRASDKEDLEHTTRNIASVPLDKFANPIRNFAFRFLHRLCHVHGI